MVEEGRDVDRLISEWHHVFTLGGLVATLPWLVNPIIRNRYFKTFFMPSKGHSTGSGHVMSVGEGFRLIRNAHPNALTAVDYLSRTRRCLRIVYSILNWLVQETYSTGKQGSTFAPDLHLLINGYIQLTTGKTCRWHKDVS